MQLVPTKGFLADWFTALTQHTVAGNYSGPLYGAYLGLVVAGSPPFTPNTVIGDLVEADFDGYARQLLVWEAPYIEQAGPETLQANSLRWSPSGTVTPNTIVGGFLASAVSAGNLLLGAYFDGNPIGMASPSDGLVVLARFSLPFSISYGDFLVSC